MAVQTDRNNRRGAYNYPVSFYKIINSFV